MKNQKNRKKTYILIPGAFHGAWSWYKVITRLEKAGQSVIAQDLPGTGMSKAPVGEASLEGWAQFICQIIDQQPEPVILVGHSRGGVVISQAAEYRPDQVEALVYVGGTLLYPGDSVIKNRAQTRSPSTVERYSLMTGKRRKCVRALSGNSFIKTARTKIFALPACFSMQNQ